MSRINLFIVADNALVVNGLRHYLEDKFVSRIQVSGFYDIKNCIENLDKEVQLLVLDYFINGKSSLQMLNAIKRISPDTEIIMHSSTEDVENSVASYLNGEKNFGNLTKKFTYKLEHQYS